jgi:hypothetical protein
MSGGDEDDKPTVVLDLNALKKQKIKAEEDLANIASELEFNIPPEGEAATADAEDFAEQFLENRSKAAPVAPKSATNSKIAVAKAPPSGNFPVILFDFGSDFFAQSKNQFPKGFDYKIIKTLPELNSMLKAKTFQIVVFNYDANPKAVNQLCAQIKAKMPTTKTMIMAKAISPEKAKMHAKTPSGAAGYVSHPIEAAKIETEFKKIYGLVKKVS